MDACTERMDLTSAGSPPLGNGGSSGGVSSVEPPVAYESDQATVEALLRDGRWALLTRPRIAAALDTSVVRKARGALDEAMALIPEGLVTVWGRNWKVLDTDSEPVRVRVAVAAFHLDRHAVTRREYARFVMDGGYEQTALWDEPVRTAVHELVDDTGRPGPHGWRNGTYPDGTAEHPVVGVCWYEARAFARWIGKRLPTDAEWIKAASWPTIAGRQVDPRAFPWGDLFDAARANLWETRIGGTRPVDDFAAGDNPVGVRQLIGNVWEWTSSDFGAFDAGAEIMADGPLKSLRGGAYDTYFPQQASWRFQSGDDVLVRRPNIGFRCALCACDVEGLAR